VPSEEVIMTSTATLTRPPVRSGGSLAGLLPAVSSAAAFGLSGSLARSLLDIGWSPAAVVAVRLGGAFAVLLIPTLLLLRRTGLPSGRQATRMLAYGVVAVATAQLCYFSAVQYLSIGVALLLEFTAPVLLIGWHWARNRRRPAAGVLAGATLALVGLVLVLDLTGGLTLSPIGVAWGLGAALCLCAYFVLSEDDGQTQPVHPLLLTSAGTGVGVTLIIGLGLAGVLSLSANTGQTVVAGQTISWLLPVTLLILVSAVFSYLAGIIAVRRLGSSIASFVALSEVIFAVIFAALLLSQQPTLQQLIGGGLILAGIAVVQRGGAAQQIRAARASRS
jgi:drug/metabolite transporter (DMT)-like permease